MTKRADADDLADLSEPLVDEASKQLLQRFAGDMLPELLSDMPVAKTFVVVGKLFNSAKEYHRTKMMLAFLHALQEGGKTMQEFDKLSDEDKNYIRGLVVAQLDLHTDERQAEATALIVDAYLWNKIDRLTFVGLLSEIKNTNPLLYYFNVDAIGVEKNDYGGAEAKGPTHLMPSAFGHNTMVNLGRWGESNQPKFVVTQLGQAFYEHVYNPMAQKYMM